MTMQADGLAKVQALNSVDIIRVRPTVTAGAYSANDVVGATLTFPGVFTAKLRAVTLVDQAKQAGAYQLVLFDSAPTNIADNGTYDIADADMLKILGAVHIADTAGADKFDLADNKVYCRQGLDLPLKSVGDGTIYGFLIALGTPTYAAVNDVQIQLNIER